MPRPFTIDDASRLRTALTAAHGDTSAAALSLSVSPRTLRRAMKRHELQAFAARLRVDAGALDLATMALAGDASGAARALRLRRFA